MVFILSFSIVSEWDSNPQPRAYRAHDLNH